MKKTQRNKDHESKPYSQIILGIIFIIIGIAFLLAIKGVIGFSFFLSISKYWPVGLILIGLAFIFRIKGVKFVLLALTIALFVISITNILHLENTISGSGKIISKDFSVRDFSSIASNIPSDIYIKQGDNYSVTLEGDENILDLISATSQDKTLSINMTDKYSFWNILPTKPIKVYISSPNIAGLAISGSGNIHSDGKINCSNLEITISGTGNVDLDVSCQNISSKISGFGKINLQGTSNSSNIVITGAGDVNAFDLVTNNSKVQISGAGSVKVYADGSLDTRISGAGSVNYKGNPQVKETISGAGSVKKS